MDEVIEILELDTQPDEASGADVVSDRVYRPTREARERLRRLRLGRAMWQCLTKINGKLDRQALAEATGLAPTVVDDCLLRLEMMGLACEVSAMRLDQFLAQTGKISAPAGDLPEQEKPAALAAQQHATEQASVPAEPEQSIQEPATYNLHSLQRLILNRSGSRRHAELTLYRIFTQVPRDLFQRAGIGSYLFIDEHTDTEDRELLKALIDQANRVLGIDVSGELARYSGRAA